MYQASQAFHNAVANNARQMAILLFDNAIFTNEDIDISSGGLTFTERFNENEELTIGTCPSSTLSVELINENTRLDGYRFGEFKATIGAMTASESYARASYLCRADCYGQGWTYRITTYSTKPYLRLNGARCDFQPNFVPYGLFINEHDVYCFSRDGQVATFSFDEHGTVILQNPINWNGLEALEWENINATWESIENSREAFLNVFAINKGKQIAEDQTGVTLNGNSLQFWYADGHTETYEMVPLGYFIAERPKHLDGETVSLEGRDRMKKFDVPLYKLEPIPYPISAGNLFAFLCTQVGANAVTTTFPNSETMLNAEPDAFRNANAIDVLRYIAELSGSVLRFNRDGWLEFCWYGESVKTIDESQYEAFSVCSYRVNSITGVKARDLSSDNETLTGSDINAYTITGNPFIGDGSSAQNALEHIHAVLSGTPEFRPSSSTVFDDWTLQAGDTLTVQRNGASYRTPIYTQTLQWDGMPVLTIENSGSETIPTENRQDREDYGKQAAQAATMRGYGASLDNERERLESYIAATDKELSELKDGTVSMWTRIYQDSERIETTASKVTSIEGRLSEAETRISQTATDITLYAKKDEVSSYINISGDGITISSGAISLNGTTIADLIDVNKLVSRFSSLSNVGVSGILSVDGTFRYKGHNYVERTVSINGTSYHILAWNGLDA